MLIILDKILVDKDTLKVAVLVTGILGLIIDQLGYYCLRIHVVSAAHDQQLWGTMSAKEIKEGEK